MLINTNQCLVTKTGQYAGTIEVKSLIFNDSTWWGLYLSFTYPEADAIWDDIVNTIVAGMTEEHIC